MVRDLALLLVGISILTLGADWLVRGASQLGQRLGVSTLVVGLTVVAFGTSAPELVVSVAAALNHHPQIAVGNVMGSTAANVGLIVGVSGLLRPISVHRRLVVRETPLVILVLSIVMLLSLNDSLGRLDGVALLVGFSVYLIFLFRWGKTSFANSNEFENGAGGSGSGTNPVPGVPSPSSAGQHPDAGLSAAEGASKYPRSGSPGVANLGGATAAMVAGEESDSGDIDPIRAAADAVAADAPTLKGAIFRILLGLPCLIIGARWLLGSAESIAVALDVPEAVIAATIIAVGTSLPELASTVAAALRGLGDIAIGNVIGSNVFNLGLVLGSAALVRPLQLSPAIVVGQVLPALAFSVLLIPLALTHQRVDRWEAGLLLSGYIAFIIWIT